MNENSFLFEKSYAKDTTIITCCIMYINEIIRCCNVCIKYTYIKLLYWHELGTHVIYWFLSHTRTQTQDVRIKRHLLMFTRIRTTI